MISVHLKNCLILSWFKIFCIVSWRSHFITKFTSEAFNDSCLFLWRWWKFISHPVLKLAETSSCFVRIFTLSQFQHCFSFFFVFLFLRFYVCFVNKALFLFHKALIYAVSVFLNSFSPTGVICSCCFVCLFCMALFTFSLNLLLIFYFSSSDIFFQLFFTWFSFYLSGCHSTFVRLHPEKKDSIISCL